MRFYTQQPLLAYIRYIYIYKQRFEVKNKRLNDGFVHYKHAVFSRHKILIYGPGSWGLLVDYCAVFVSSLDSHSDGTHVACLVILIICCLISNVFVTSIRDKERWSF